MRTGKPKVDLKGNPVERILSVLLKSAFLLVILVDERGFEPPASSLRTMSIVG